MKIAHIVCSYPPYTGGMGNVAFEMVRELKNRGHELVVYTPGFYKKKEIKPVIAKPEKTHAPALELQLEEIQRVEPKLQYGNAAYLPTIQEELDQFDVVHLHYPFFGTANLVKQWKLKHPEKALVISYHMDNRAKGWKGWIFDRYSRWVMPGVLNAADALIGSTLEYIEHSDAAWHYKKHTDTWVEIPFGVDTARFTPAIQQPEEPTLLFVGGMDKAHDFKGVPVLLKALYILSKRGYRPRTLLVGGGDLQQQFIDEAQGLDLDHVEFLGKVSDEELPLCYQQASVLVFPSTQKNEAFGMVALEAFASGLPVIASNLPGVRTVIGERGVLVEPGHVAELAQAIEQFLQHGFSKSSEEIRAAAEEEFSLSSATDVLEKVYDSVVK